MADFTRKIIIELGNELDPPRFTWEAPPGSDFMGDLAAAGNVLNWAALPADTPEQRQRQIDAWWHRMASWSSSRRISGEAHLQPLVATC